MHIAVRVAFACAIALAALPAQAQILETSSYVQHEAARQQRIAQQIGLQDYVRWQAGLPPRQGGAVWPSLDYLYSGMGYGPYSGWPTPFVFEPWPFVPGDILGAPYAPSVPQSTGYEFTPTGPNGYIYRPTYATKLPVAAVTPRAVPLVPPSLKRVEPRATAPEELPPPLPTGVREF